LRRLLPGVVLSIVVALAAVVLACLMSGCVQRYNTVHITGAAPAVTITVQADVEHRNTASVPVSLK
jgi:hypothetical protein